MQKIIGIIKKLIINRSALLVVSALIVGISLSLSLQFLSAFTAPACPPWGCTMGEEKYIDTTAIPQEKAGNFTANNITANGDLTGTNIIADTEAEGESQGVGFFKDAYFSNIDKFASEIGGMSGKIPFDVNCYWYPAGEGEGLGCPDQYYVVTNVKPDFALPESPFQVYCCKANIPQPPVKVDIKFDQEDLTISGKPKLGTTYYFGVAKITVTNSKTGAPISGAKVIGQWSGMTDKCSDGSSTICQKETADGQAAISSNSLKAQDIIDNFQPEERKFCFKINDIQDVIYTSLPPERCVTLSGVGTELLVDSIKITPMSVPTSDWLYKGVAEVKITDNAGIPVQGVKVDGDWSGSFYTASASPKYTNEFGIAIFETSSVYCWKSSDGQGAFVFSVTALSSAGPQPPEGYLPQSDLVNATVCTSAPLFVKDIKFTTGPSTVCGCADTTCSGWPCTPYCVAWYTGNIIEVTILDSPPDVEEVTVSGTLSLTPEDPNTTSIEGLTPSSGIITLFDPTCDTMKCFTLSNLDKMDRLYAPELNMMEQACLSE